MNKAILASLGLAAFAISPSAQQVTPVWVHHINGSINGNPADAIPVLVKNVGAPYINQGPGTSKQFAFGKIARYDSTRLLLMVKENGIAEGDAGNTPAQNDLAAAYPDRSLVWIDIATGKPLGVAHRFPVKAFVALGQANNNDYYTSWGIDEGPEGQRALYSTHRYGILRWAPKAGGGWEDTFTYAWIEPTPGAKDENGNDLDGSSRGDGSQSWRWRDFRVTGSGDKTMLMGGGGTWRASQHSQVFKTDDGLKFYPVARFNDRDGGRKGNYSQGGLTSSVIQYGLDPERPNLQTAYHGRYPGTGWGARPSRFLMDPDSPVLTYPDTYNPGGLVGVFQVDNNAAGALPAFQWESAGDNGLPINHSVDGVEYYDGNWGGILDAKPEVEYIVNYAFPSWDNQFGSIKKPGWIGVHRLDGKIASNSGFKLPFTERDIQSNDAGPNTGSEWGYDGDIVVIPDLTAPAELDKSTVLWAGSGYGYGVFTVQNVAPSITLEPSDISLTENGSFTLDVQVAGSPNTYQWSKDGVALDPAATKDDGSPYYVRSVVAGVTKSRLTVTKAKLADSGKYKLSVVNPLGQVASREITVTVSVDTVPPTVVSAANGRSATSSYVRLVFSEEVVPESAGDAANYKLNGQPVLNAAPVGVTGAIIEIPTIEPGAEAVLSVSNVRDIAEGAGNPVAAGTTVSISGPSLVQGKLLWEYYGGISGTAVNLVEESAKYPGLPDRWESMSAANTDVDSLSNIADNFGARISGWITPAESGEYRFFIRSDDASHLYISDSADAAGATLVAFENGCCGAFREPDAANTTTSEPINLTAGTSYYIAMVYKEGGGGDWAQLAWRKEGDTTAAGSLTPIPGKFFKSYRVSGHGPVFSTPTVSGGAVTLTWAGTGTLQVSTDLKTWSDVGGAVASPFVVPIAGNGPQRFYRLIK